MPYKSRPPELMDKLTLEEIKLVDRLFETAFKGYAQARIAKLKPHILDALVTMCTSPKDVPVAPNASTEDKVKRVLEAKDELVELQRRMTEERCSTPAPPTEEPVPAPAAEAGDDLPGVGAAPGLGGGHRAQRAPQRFGGVRGDRRWAAQPLQPPLRRSRRGGWPVVG